MCCVFCATKKSPRLGACGTVWCATLYLMEPQEPHINNINGPEETRKTQEHDPYAGIFFEVDTLMNQARAGCVEKLRALAVREPSPEELFACIEVYQNNNFGLNYNTFRRDGDDVTADFESLQDGDSFIPGLEEHLETYMRGKPATTEEQDALTDKLRKRLFDFFSSSWREAGGESAPVPTYFSFEEEHEYIDMKDGSVHTEEELVAELGAKDID